MIIKKFENIILVGTSHVAKKSRKDIKNIILKEQPSLVCLELDLQRLNGLFSKKKKAKVKNIFLRLIQFSENLVAKK